MTFTVTHFVIASEAKQPRGSIMHALGCFASLAMTKDVKIIPLKWCPAGSPTFYRTNFGNAGRQELRWSPPRRDDRAGRPSGDPS